MQEKPSIAVRAVGAKSAAELLAPGVLAVLVVPQRLAIAALVRTVFALEDGRLGLFSRAVLQLHVFAEFAFALAGVSTDLANQRLGLVTQLVAVKLVGAVTAV